MHIPLLTGVGTAEIDLGRGGHRHDAIATEVGISAGTVSRWLQAHAFPSGRFAVIGGKSGRPSGSATRAAGSSRRAKRTILREGSRRCSLTRNAGRRTRSVTWPHSSGRAPKRAICADWPSSFGPCCDGGRRHGSRHGCTPLVRLTVISWRNLPGCSDATWTR
jgi:hypothetical protein